MSEPYENPTQLVDAIFSAIESADPAFNQSLFDDIAELVQEPDQGKEIKPEDVRGWLRSLSDKALEQG